MIYIAMHLAEKRRAHVCIYMHAPCTQKVKITTLTMTIPGQQYKEMVICAGPGQRAKIRDVPDGSRTVGNYVTFLTYPSYTYCDIHFIPSIIREVEVKIIVSKYIPHNITLLI